MVKGIIAGNFDVIHPGYIEMFKECALNCDSLIVLLHTDPSIERPHKLKPILSSESYSLPPKGLWIFASMPTSKLSFAIVEFIFEWPISFDDSDPLIDYVDYLRHLLVHYLDSVA